MADPVRGLSVDRPSANVDASLSPEVAAEHDRCSQVFKCAAAATKPDCSAMTFLSLKVFGHIFKSEEEAMTALPEVLT
jgi:hypothetical protein